MILQFVTRLLDMSGPYLISSSLIGVLAQRLVRLNIIVQIEYSPKSWLKQGYPRRMLLQR